MKCQPELWEQESSFVSYLKKIFFLNILIPFDFQVPQPRPFTKRTNLNGPIYLIIFN